MWLKKKSIPGLDFSRRHWILRYGIASGFVLAALLLNSFPVVATPTPFLFFFATVALTARICGFGAAVFSTIISGLAANYFLVPPRFAFATSTPDLLRLLFFVAVCLVISSIARRTSQLEKAGEADRAQLAAIVESSDDAIFSKKLDGTITNWNQGAERLYGWTREEIVGKNVKLLVVPEKHRDVDDILKRLSQGQRIDHHETRRVRKNGSQIDISLSIAPLFDADGQVIGAASIARDITARKLAEEALRKTEKLAAAGRLAATIAHEINNPLASVTNLLYLLRQNKSLDEKARKHLALAEQEMRRVAHLARQTLGFYRDTSSAGPVDLCLVMNEVLDVYGRQLESKRIAVNKEYREQVHVLAFSGEIRQVFSNLIANAIDAMSTDGRLIVRVAKSRNWAKELQPGGRVTISDSGSGIRAEHKPKLFEPFYTTKKEVGTGLGLWLSKEIIAKHGGSISVRSNVGATHCGTVFSVFLPEGSPSERVEPKPQRLQRIPRQQASSSKLA
jgi:PAS domain S-box-containing protein